MNVFRREADARPGTGTAGSFARRAASVFSVVAALAVMASSGPVAAEPPPDSDPQATLRGYMERGDFAAAEAAAARLLDGFHAGDRADSLRLLDYTMTLAEARLRLGKMDDPALADLVASQLELSRTLLGPDDLTTARAHQCAGYFARYRDDADAERAHFEAALDIVERSPYSGPAGLAVALDNLAKTYRRLGQDEEAAGLLQRSLSMLESTLPPGHPQIGTTLLNLTLVRIATGDTTGASAAFDRVAAIYEQADPGGLRLAETLCREGVWRLGTGDPEGAARALDRALGILESHGGTEPSMAGCLLARAQAGLALHDAEAALEWSRRARELALAREGRGPEFAACLVAEGDALRGMGRHREATADYEAALAILESAGEGGRSALSDCLRALTAHSLELARYGDALGFARRALQVETERSGDRSPRAAKARVAYAAALRSAGEPDSALVQCRRALADLEAAGGNTAEARADVMLQLAALARERRDVPAARDHAEQAARLFGGLSGPARDKQALALHEMGIALRRLGNERAARDTLERALGLASRGGRSTAAVAAILSSMATLQRALGDTAAASSNFREAMGILRDVLPAEHPQRALVLRNLASLDNAAGRYHRAEDLYRQALAILRPALGDDHPDVAATRLGLGNALKAEGRLEEAQEEYELAVDIHRRALGPEAPPLALDYYNLAALSWEMDEPQRAVELAVEAERLSRRHFRLVAQGASEREALNYAAGRVSGADIVLTAVAPGDSARVREGAWDLVIRSRGLVFEEIAQRRRFVTVTGRDAEVARLASALEKASDDLAHLVVRGRGEETRDVYMRQLDASRAAKEEAERNLAAASREFRARQARRSIGLAEVLDALPPRSALVAWVRFGLLERHAGEEVEGPAHEGRPWYAAFVVESGARRVRLVRLGGAARIDSLVAVWHERAGEGLIARSREAAEEEYRKAGGELRRAVWDPVALGLDGLDRIYLVPDGALSLVSFDALPDDSGGFLLEHAPLFHILSSERELIDDHVDSSPGRGLLTLADPDYDRSPPPVPVPLDSTRSAKRGVSCGRFSSMWFGPLSGSAIEQEKLVRLWRDLGSGSGASEDAPARVLTGGNATEEAFRRFAGGREVIHIATHGFYLGSECAGRRPTGAAAEWDELTVAGLVAESPLLLSGLALAGANNREEAPGPTEDGIMTAEEIASMDLDGVDLVVLSACETGLGRVEAGEGVFGLRRAFQVAGVRNLVMTLWPIDDKATVPWMEAMFEHRLREKTCIAEAGRAASLDVIRARRARGETDHPFYWGAFVAAGDWR